jgi:cell division protein FtsW (lipid II flippase)
VGLGTLYALQVFLTIGGVIKFIPSTGVTLPLVSYGGSSLLATMIVFGIIQGLYIVEFDERAQSKEKQQKGGQPRGTKRREKAQK